MKITHVSANDSSGGAARSTFRLHTTLKEQGVDSNVFVWQKFSEDPDIHEVFANKRLQQLKASIAVRMARLQKYPLRFYQSINVFPSRLHKAINSSNCDIVHFQWIGAEMIRIEDIPKIQKPIVWTLRDMWAFCGAEHCEMNDSNRFIEGYYRNNIPADQAGIDIDRWVWRRKCKAWRNMPVYLVTPSTWMADCCRKSFLFRNHDVEVIHNGMETDIFSPMDKKNAKNQLGLNPQKKYVLFGAAGIDAKVKGFDLLIEALKKCTQTNADISLLVFGAESSKHLNDIKVPCKFLSHLDNNGLRMAYSAADVMVVPSRMESFGQTAAEALACGTPVVAFNATGLKDIILHQICGYLAKPFDTEELANGINWVLADTSRHEKLCSESRRQAEAKFDIRQVAQKYTQLYERILNENKSLKKGE